MLNTDNKKYTETDGFQLMISRIHARLTQIQLARKVGLSQARISLIERNETNATEDEVKRIKAVLEASG